jgi:IBR domain, a half RING-finger domain
MRFFTIVCRLLHEVWMDITLSSSSASPGAAHSQGSVTKGPGQWFSMRRILRDFRRLGNRRQSHKLSGSRNRQEAVTANSSSFYLDEDEASRADDTSSVLIECPVCTFMQPPSSFPVFPNVSCRHRTCVDCVRCYLTVEINESRTDIACPVCSARIHPDDIRQFLSSDYALLIKYEEFSLRRALVVDPDVRWCPAPDCGYVGSVTSKTRELCAQEVCNDNYAYGSWAQQFQLN